ncbi:MAG: hypothetical protein ABI481_02825 [Pyrinomonadaceae bacterium]
MSSHAIDRDSLFFRSLSADFKLGDDTAQLRLFREYGAVFVARGGVIAPNKVVFRDERDVEQFQSKLDISGTDVAGLTLQLQTRAMDGLLKAINKATEAGLSITPRGADSARRNYNDTVELWKSRVEPALVHWVGNERITQEQADSIRDLSPYEQLPEIFHLEENGIFFAKDLTKSIIYSVAPPGASQHLSLLAFDIVEFEDPAVRQILAENHWYQTVTSDLPHFTFLGVAARELEGLGLRPVENNGRRFWIPDV